MKLKLLFLIFLFGLFFGHAQINSISIVGENAGGWPGTSGNPGPTDLHQMISADGENWSIQGLILSDAVAGGGFKFRANNEWFLNWGADAFPSGVGLLDGLNIICPAGIYDVAFNSTTGVYTFTGGNPQPSVKLVGTATANASGIPMATNNGVLYTISNTALLTGNAQFEVNGLLVGGDTFPSGITTNDPLLIPVIEAEYSTVTFNIQTGEYNFTFAPLAINANVSISGSAIGSSNDIQMNTTDGIIFNYVNLATTQGELHFINNTVPEIYGNAAFPTGIATLNGSSIVIPTGTWSVTFNLITKGLYFLQDSAGNPTISIVGDGAGGWPTGAPDEIDTNQMITEDGINYTIYALTVTEGAVKFREDNNWTINWGAVSFPSGIGIQGGENIAITAAGTYTVTFNRLTGEYNFGTPNRIAIVGTGAGGWPTGAIGEIDAHPLESTDGIHFRLNDIELTDGEVKFRQNNSWDVFWGGTSLNGNLILNGPSIATTAGTYSLALNRITGDYSLATNVPSMRYFRIYPNPTNNVWNFTSAKQAIQSIQLVDVLGKTVMTITPKDMTATVDASSLNSGLYFAKISTANAIETVKLIKN